MQYEKLKSEYGVQLQRTKELEMERLLFIKEIQDCESYIAWKEDEIARLNSRIESLTTDLKKDAQLQSRSVTYQNVTVDNFRKRIDELENEAAAKEDEKLILSEQLAAEKQKSERIQDALKNLARKYFELMNKSKVGVDNSRVRELEDLIAIRNKKIEELERDREVLSEELRDCEDYITNQVNEMKKLSSYIDFLTHDSQTRQSQRKLKVSSVSKPEEIQTCVPCTDPTCLARRVQLLEKKVSKYKTKLTKQEENRKTLLAKIEEEKQSKGKIEEAFMKTAQIYEELVRKNQCFKDLQRECEMYKNQNKQLSEMKKKVERVRNLENEKQNLTNEIRLCKCDLKDKDKRIKNLCDEIESMRQNETQIKNTLQGMETYVSEWAQNLENAENELERLTNERGCMCNRIEELEVQIEDYEDTIMLLDEKNKILLQTLEQERHRKAELDVALEMIAKSDEHLKKMLQHARQTIKCITQKMEQYDIERLETQKDYQIKICELEAQLVTAKATIGKLRGNLDKMKNVMDKNVAQKTLSYQLHEAANIQVNELQEANEDLSRRGQKMAEMYNYLKQVLYEKDKTFEDLRNQLFVLKQQLDSEQQRREQTEDVLADVAASGDSALAELHNVINTQNEEITRLNIELEELMDNTPNGHLKTQIKQLQEKNSSLENEIQELRVYLSSVLPGLKQMRTELDKQKKEIENQKKMRMDTMMHVQAKLNERSELCQRVRELVTENQELKRINSTKPAPTVVLMEKGAKDDGSVKYKCLYGVTAEEKEGKNPSEKIRDRSRSPKPTIKAPNPTPTAEKKVQTTKQAPTAFQKVGEEDPNKKKKEANKKESPGKTFEDTYRNLFQMPVGATLATSKKDDQLERKLEKASKELEELKKKLTDVRKEKENLTKDLQEAFNEIKKLKIEVNKPQPTTLVQKEKAQKSDPLSSTKVPPTASFSKEREKLLEQIQQQKEEIANMLKKIEDPIVSKTLREELKSTQNENRKLKELINGLQNQLRNSVQNIAQGSGNLEKIVTTLQNDLQSEQKRIAESEERWKSCVNKYEQMKRVNEDLENQNKELRTKIDELTPKSSQVNMNHLEDVDKNIRLLEDHINDAINNLKTQVENMATKVTTPALDESKIQKVLEEIDSLKKQVQESIPPKKRVSIITDRDKNIKDLESQLQDSEKKKQNLEDRVKNLEGTIELLKGDALMKWPSTEDMKKFLPVALKDSERRIQEIKKENQNLKQEIKKLRAQDPEAEQNVEDYDPEQRLKALENTLRKESQLFHSAAPSTTKIGDLEDILKEWQREYDREIAKLRKELENVSNRGSIHSTGCPAHENVIKELREALRGSQNQYNDLEKRYTKLQDENERIGKFLENVEEAETGSIPTEIEETKRIRELVEHVKHLEKKNESLRTQNIKLDVENKTLKNDLGRIIGPDHTDFEKELQRLRDLERQVTRSQEKYQHMKKRLMKVEIENRNLKKDFIDTLIAKEKILLQSHEQEKRLRETNKLLKKSQDKTQNLTNKIIKLQVENENLKLLQETHQEKELDEQLQKYEEHIVDLLKKIAELEAEIEQLKWHLAKLGYTGDEEDHVIDNAQQMKDRQGTEVLKMKLIQLEVENEFMRRELDEMKGKEVSPFDKVGQRISKDLQKLKDDDANLQMKKVELEVENEFLKNQLIGKEQEVVDDGVSSKQCVELADKVKHLAAVNEALKIKTVEMEVENEYLKKELDQLQDMKETKKSDKNDTDYEKASHVWKLKADNLEVENRQLKAELANLVKERMSLETHTVHKILNEMERLIREYESIGDTPLNAKSKEGIAERMRKWREHYDPVLDQLKKDLVRLTAKEKSDSSRLEEELADCRATVEKLELDNKNFHVALELLLKEKPSLQNISLVNEVQHLLAKHQEEQKFKKDNLVDVHKVREAEKRLEECQAVNKLLRNEQVSLESHLQERRIRQLESELSKTGATKMSAENSQPPISEVSKVPSFLEVRTTKLQELVDELKETQAEMVKELESLRTENKTLNINLEEQKEINVILQAEVEKFRQLSEVQENLAHDLDKQLQECKEKFQREKKVSFMDFQEEQRFQELEKEYEDLKERYFALKKEFKEMESRVQELEERLRKCREINRSLKDQMQEMRERSGSDGSVQKTYPKIEKFRDPPPDLKKKEEEPTKDNLEVELDKLQKMENRLLERQNSIESMTQEIGFLYNEHLSLRVYMRRVKELEQRLLESHANNRIMKIELETIRRTESILNHTHSQRRVNELQNRLEESCNKNKIINEELTRLRTDLEFKEETEKELKESVNSLEQDNKNMKNEINNLIQEKDRLLEKNKELMERNNELQASGDGKTQEILNLNLMIDNLNNKIRSLEERDGERSTKNTNDGEINKLKATIDELTKQNEELSKRHFEEIKGSLFLTELEKRNEENRRLKLVNADLRAQVEHLSKLQESEEVGSGEKRVRTLEETLLKYQNNNESLKTKIKQLEAENESLKANLGKTIKSEAQAAQIRKLEETLQKYQDNNKSLKTKVARLSGDSHVVELEELRDQVEKCQTSNEDLKNITIQLDSEIKYIKKEIEGILKKESTENEQQKQNETSKAPSELSITTDAKTDYVESKHEQGQPEHHINKFVQNLKKQYKKDIDVLVKHAQLVISRMAPNLETYSRQPALIGIQQPVALPVQQPAYTAVPVMWQPQMLPYGQYAPPPNQEEATTEKEIAKLNCLAEKIQETLDRSKRFLESEILNNTEPRKTTSDEEEREEKCFDFETCSMTHSQTVNSSPGVSSLGSRFTANVKINKLHQRQEQTRDRISNLQNKINETMKQLNEETQKCHVLTTDTTVLPNDRSQISVQKSNFGRYKVTNIVSKYSSISGPSVPHHFHGGSKEEKKGTSKCTSRSQHSKNSSNSRKSFDSVKK